MLFAGDSVDLSLGGLYLRTEIPLNLGEHISLIINLPTFDDAVSCDGRVAWVNPSLASSKPHFPSGVGGEFVHLTSTVEGEIKRFINWRTPRESTQTINNMKEALEDGKYATYILRAPSTQDTKSPPVGVNIISLSKAIAEEF